MQSVESIRKEKARWRTHFRDARLALRDADYAARSALIRDRIHALPEVARARTVHVYWPLVARREVDTRPLILDLHARGVRVVLPVVARPGQDGPPLLRHALFEGEDRLVPNRWGLLEPSGADVDVATIDLVLVPAFGAGRNGHRIGHGAGFYDAFLAGLRARTVAVVFETCLVERIPAEPHDYPLDLIVTESEVWPVPPYAPP